jgi:hypothetical protein
MTSDQAWALKFGFDRLKVTIERTEILADNDRSYALLVAWVDGSEEIFKDVEKCEGALVHAMLPELIEGDLFATLGDDGVPVLCDFETHRAWIFSNAERTKKTFSCSREIDATVHFSGHSPAEYSMDGHPRFWALSFYNRTKKEHYGCGPGVFEIEAEANAFVERYISAGCPLPGTIDWLRFR